MNNKKKMDIEDKARYERQIGKKNTALGIFWFLAGIIVITAGYLTELNNTIITGGFGSMVLGVLLFFKGQMQRKKVFRKNIGTSVKCPNCGQWRDKNLANCSNCGN